jgi:hypothetical protein
MRTKLICLAVLAAGLGGRLPTPSAAQVSGAPFQSRLFVTDGVVAHVDSTRDRLIMNRDNGQACLLDTSQADITLLDGNRAGTTPDLTPGMRVHVTGRQISSGLVEVAHLHVLKPGKPAMLARPQGPDTAAAAGEDIQLRGTVDTVDTRRGVFVVRVQSHTRTIYLAGDTDLSGMALRDPNRFAVKPGDRVTVAGRLQPDGGVLAGTVSLSKTITLPANTLPRPDRVLFGRITSVSNRFTSRDIKIRLSNDRELKVKVGRGLSIRRDGRAISVHDLRGGDDVRVTGSFDGMDFKADRIDMLHREEGPDTLAPTRGL